VRGRVDGDCLRHGGEVGRECPFVVGWCVGSGLSWRCMYVCFAGGSCSGV
jgi:hypothetical protein